MINFVLHEYNYLVWHKKYEIKHERKQKKQSAYMLQLMKYTEIDENKCEVKEKRLLKFVFQTSHCNIYFTIF